MAISKDLLMPRGTVNTIIQRYKKTGQMKKGKRTGRPLSRLISRNRRTPLIQILATFNASNDVSISKRTFDKYCRRMRFLRGPSVKTKGITTPSPKDQTGMVQTPKILDCRWPLVHSYLQRRKYDQSGGQFPCLCVEKERRGLQTGPLRREKQFSQITFQSYGMGLHYLVRCRNAFFCGRQYRCRKILGYTRGEFVASYCATVSCGWHNISTWWDTGAYG